MNGLIKIKGGLSYSSNLFLKFLLALIFGIQFSLSGHAQSELQQDATQLRSFLREAIEASGRKDSKQQVADLKKSLASHPELLQWFASGKDINAIIKAAEIPDLPSNVVKQLNSFRNIGGYLKTANESLLKLEGITTDAFHLEKMNNQGIIKNILKIAPGMLIGDLGGLGKRALIGILFLESEKRLKKKVMSMNNEDRLKLLNMVPHKYYLTSIEKINEAIDNAKFSNSPAIKMIKDPKTGFDMSYAPKKLATLFDIVINSYFDKLPVEDKRSIAIGLLELPVGSSDVKKLSNILNNAGPVLQKLFQLFGKDVKSPLVAEVMAELKSNIKPFSAEEAKRVITESYGKKMKDLFSSFKDKPLAAASVGQVHLAKLKGSNREVIVKILRPGLEAKAQREINMLKGLAPDEGSRKIIEQLEESLMAELDFNEEAKNLEEGIVYENLRKGIIPVKLAPELPVKKHVMVMEKAPGKTIDKVKDEELYAKGEALKSFLEIWFDEALFNDGFFHGDLHAGNIFLKTFDPEDEQDQEDKSNISSKIRTDYILTPIDFGSAGRLTPDEQKGIIRLALGAIFGSPSTIITSLESFYKMTPEQEKVFRKFVVKTSANKDLTPFDIMNAILNKAIELEFKLPKNLIMFNRGRMFLEKHFDELNEKLEEYDPYESLPRYQSFEVYRNVVIKRLSADLVKKMIGLQDDEDSYLNDETIGHLVDEFFIPQGKKYAKKAAVCVAKGAYGLTYSFLEQTNQFLQFLDPVPQPRNNYQDYGPY